MLIAAWLLSSALSFGPLLAAGCLAVAWSLARGRSSPWQLYADRLFVEPLHGPPFELPLEHSAATRAEGGLVVTAHQGKTLTVPDEQGADLLAVLLDLGRAGYLISGSPPDDGLTRVLGQVRTEVGDAGALMMLGDQVLFLPHQSAAAMMSSFTGRAPIVRHAADVMLQGLGYMRPPLVDSLLSSVPPAVGLRVWRKSELQVSADRLPRGEDAGANEPGGSVTIMRGAELLEVHGTVGQLDSLIAALS